MNAGAALQIHPQISQMNADSKTKKNLRKSAQSADNSSSPYQQTLAWLYSLQRFGIKLGLENIRRLLTELSLPGKGQRIIHVAGTNGKGSVCAMIDSILRTQGYRTGLFTSPHLVSFRERIRVDGEMISEEAVVAGLTRIRELVARWEPHPTFFEIVTALALHHFRDARCEFVVLETGLGGRLDATNATKPIVSVITPINYDHQQWLGHSLGEIAGEKAGIIKPHTPVVSALQLPEAENVIRQRADACGSPLHFITGEIESPLALAGRHQKQNAALAVAVLKAAQIAVDDDAISRGLAALEWPARFQRWDDRTIIDGAHNPAGARALAETWRKHFGDQRATIVLAVLADKDVAGLCDALAPITAHLLLPHIRTERALPPQELASIWTARARPQGAPEIDVQIFPTIPAALKAARSHHEPVLITGSLHFAGEALAELRGVPAAFEECAQ